MSKSILMVLACLYSSLLAASPTLSIYHLDVGQGDATLVVSPTRSLLIDGGDTGRGISKVVPVLQALRMTSLDYTVATHYDADHIGGLDEVIMALPEGVIEKAYDRGGKGTTKAFEDYLDAVEGKRTTIKLGERIDLGDGIEALCVAVNQEVSNGASIDPKKEDENGNSVAILIRHNEFDYFIGGDLTGGGRSGSKITPDVESLVAQVVGDVDVLKVSHHGSKTSSNERFVTVLNPEIAIISVGNRGKNTRYKHPHHSVLSNILSLPTLRWIYMTNRGETRGGLNSNELKKIRIVGSNVVVTTNGESYTVNGCVLRTDGIRSSFQRRQGDNNGQ